MLRRVRRGSLAKLNQICIACPAPTRLWSVDHGADALRIEWLAVLVDVAGLGRPGADPDEKQKPTLLH
jgi:hypothetical protein